MMVSAIVMNTDFSIIILAKKTNVLFLIYANAIISANIKVIIPIPTSPA